MRALVVTVLTVCSLGVGLTSPAYAEKHVADDPAGDAVVSSAVIDYQPAPDHTDADVVRSTVSHRRGSVVIRLRLRDLHRVTTRDQLQVIVKLKTPQRRWYVTLTQRQGKRAQVQFSGPNPCTPARPVVSPADDLIRISLPRTCLKKPRWVQVGSSVAFGNAHAYFQDDPLRSGAYSDRWQLTPRLKRC